ncbi:Clavaminate synthase-like protein [Nemania sp. NC0429]|nr:Clavaminate synthase-like protein [Nemania sp. NC0429]KAI1109906.1 Clavaminate synthase-like protein [Nemania sp. NC0429]
MSVASMHILYPISPHRDRGFSDESNTFHSLRANRGQEENGSNRSSRGDVSPYPNTKSLTVISNAANSTRERAKAAAIVLNRYRIEYKNDWDFPESILRSEAQIHDALERKAPIELVIPAFPFKSSNRSKKVLGPLPDEAERLSLLHLHGLCLAIKDVTDADTFLTIVSDGITYNDILGVSDQEVWRYGQQLRQMAEQNDCHCIRFSRIWDLVGAEHDAENLNETLYLARASEYRRLLEAATPVGFDVLDAIANDVDILKTYKGYKKFLMSERDDRIGRSRSETERENSGIAKAMIVRGKAFAETISAKYPVSVRLSIHPSNDTKKVSIIMLPQDNKIVMTPWHGAVVRGADGSVSMSHAILVPALTHDIVYVDGRPSYFRERSHVFDWAGLDVTFEYLYPCGIIIRPAKRTATYPLSMVDMQKIRTLATTCSPVVLRGFSESKNYSKCITTTFNFGWYDSEMNETIKDEYSKYSADPRSSNGVSAETTLIPYENKLKASILRDEINMNKEDISNYPQFQVLTWRPAVWTGDDQTLFASSDLFACYLPQAYNINKLEKIKWKYRSQGQPITEDVPLVVRHPTRNSPCVIWHRPWQKWRTSFGSDDIRIENGSQSLIPLVDSFLSDRRVCLRFSWQAGDVVISDSFTMLHTGGSLP